MEDFEKFVQKSARKFAYPPTPNLVSHRRQQRGPVWSYALVAAVTFVLTAVLVTQIMPRQNAPTDFPPGTEPASADLSLASFLTYPAYMGSPDYVVQRFGADQTIIAQVWEERPGLLGASYSNAGYEKLSDVPVDLRVEEAIRNTQPAGFQRVGTHVPQTTWREQHFADGTRLIMRITYVPVKGTISW